MLRRAAPEAQSESRVAPIGARSRAVAFIRGWLYRTFAAIDFA